MSCTQWHFGVSIIFENVKAFDGTYYNLLFKKLLLSEFFYPLLGCARSRDRCWAAIRLSHRREPSGRAVHGEVDGLDIGGQHGRRFVLLRHTHRPQRRPYPICTSRKLIRRNVSVCVARILVSCPGNQVMEVKWCTYQLRANLCLACNCLKGTQWGIKRLRTTYNSVVQLQARGTHVARGQNF